MKKSFGIKKLPSAYKEAFAMHELLRKFGFPPEDVSLHYDEGKLGVVLLSQGLDFYLEVGELDDTFEEFEKNWKTITYAIKTYQVSDEDLQEIWVESAVCKNTEQLLMVLTDIGFKFPPKQGKTNKQLN